MSRKEGRGGVSQGLKKKDGAAAAAVADQGGVPRMKRWRGIIIQAHEPANGAKKAEGATC